MSEYTAGQRIEEGPYQGGRVLVVVNVVWRQNEDKPEYQLLRVAQGAVTFYTVRWNLINEWGEIYKSVEDLYALIPEYTLDDYTFEFDRLYPLFPPRLMQDLDTGLYDKKDPNLDYVSRLSRRGFTR